MANLNQFDVVEKANKGSVLELLACADIFDEKTGDLLISQGDVLTDEGEKCADKKNIKPLYLRLLGSDSDVYRKSLNRRIEKIQNSKNSKNNKIDLKDLEIKTAKLLAKCTTECYIIEDDKIIECTTNEMTRLYLKYPWLRDQAEEFMHDRSNLMTS